MYKLLIRISRGHFDTTLGLVMWVLAVIAWAAVASAVHRNSQDGSWFMLTMTGAGLVFDGYTCFFECPSRK
jgi:hypothetical protein